MVVGFQYKLLMFIQDDWHLLHVGLCNIKIILYWINYVVQQKVVKV